MGDRLTSCSSYEELFFLFGRRVGFAAAAVLRGSLFAPCFAPAGPRSRDAPLRSTSCNPAALRPAGASGLLV